jgi:hypothetical protein
MERRMALRKILREKLVEQKAQEILNEMTEEEAKELAKRCAIRTFKQETHASKVKYPLPHLVFRMDTPEDANRFLDKWSGVWRSRPNIVEVNRELLVQAFLKRMLPYLEGEEKRKALIALKMLEVALNKPPRWKEKLIDLGKELCRSRQ